MKTKKEKPVNVEIKEFDKEIDILITPNLKRDKIINIIYAPFHANGETIEIIDNVMEKLRIDRKYPVGGIDGEIDWEKETLYPCDNCETKMNLINRKSDRIKELEKLIKKIAEID